MTRTCRDVAEWQSCPVESPDFGAARESGCGRYCCKSHFASLIAKFQSHRRDVRINMWGATSSLDEITGDFGDRLEAISIGDYALFRFLTEK